MASDDARTIFIGNLSDRLTEELLYELFLQTGPIERVRIPTDREGRKSNFGFVTMKHEISVEYACRLLDGTKMFDRPINVKRRNWNQQQQQRRPNAPPPRITQEPQINDEYEGSALYQSGRCGQQVHNNRQREYGRDSRNRNQYNNHHHHHHHHQRDYQSRDGRSGNYQRKNNYGRNVYYS